MSSSETLIANRALTKLGEARILTLADDSNPGRVLNSMYAAVRDAELRRYRWKFAIKRDSLVALAAAPAWGYLYQYPLPSDYLALIQVNDIYIRPASKAAAPWSVESNDDGLVLLTDLQAPLKIRYVKRIENAGAFDPLFVEVLACALALEACEALTQSDTKLKARRDGYTYALSEAVRADAIENPPDELPWGTWLESREGASIGLTGSSQFLGTSGFSIDS